MPEVMDEPVTEPDEIPDGMVRCHDCSNIVPTDSTIEQYEYLPGNPGVYEYVRYCSGCRAPCQGCGDYQHPDEMRYFARVEMVIGDCCTRACYDCGQPVPDRGEYYSRRSGGNYYCEDCGDEDEDGTIQPYRHTRANRWLRLPDEPGRRSDPDRYYLGFELEIGTDRMTARPILNWAERNLGYSDAMECKEDSSVDGFEIVSQPMTPGFFESVDWDGFFDMLNNEYPCPSGAEEYDGHGLHVHIGRTAFDRDDIMMAAYAYLLSQSEHLERIGRRQPTEYCNKVRFPVKAAIASVQEKADVQARRIRAMGIYPGRDAINLTNDQTIEIRAFRSTRKASELRDAVRVTYAAAEYVRSLRESKIGLAGKSLHWSEFSKWVALNLPDAFPGISGTDK